MYHSTQLSLSLELTLPDKHQLLRNKIYICSWNKVVTALGKSHPFIHTFRVEAFRDAALRGLLNYKNVEACQAVLDCTQEYLENGIIPTRR